MRCRVRLVWLSVVGRQHENELSCAGQQDSKDTVQTSLHDCNTGALHHASYCLCNSFAPQVDELTLALGLHSIRNHDWHIQVWFSCVSAFSCTLCAQLRRTCIHTTGKRVYFQLHL